MSCSWAPSPCDLRTAVAIQRFTPTADAQGGRAKVWATIETAFAFVKEGSGSEKAWGDGRRSTGALTAYMRFTDVTARDRVIINGELFNISYVDDIRKRKQWLKLHLEANITP